MSEKIVILLGDSLTEFNHWDELAPNSDIVNQGHSGDTAMGVFYRLNQVCHAHPEVVFLQVGINDLAQGREPLDIVKAHQKIWRALLERIPGLRLVVCSLIPTRVAKFVWDGSTLDNNRVRQTNELLFQAAQANKLDYLDLYSVMAGPDQELPNDFTDDGVHLTSAAYRVWEKELKAFLAKDKPLS
ncbi:MAG: GDSL-type esterase/lipase family protein [Deltaproteobacteria bacterium]|jgi:lysophospholipase L1-like esterase|nr:GDSL-type esterase/lipase family protein [Deltaproteobacteria bacterium]